MEDFTNKCFICEVEFADTDDDCVRVRKKGITSLEKVSQERGDNKLNLLAVGLDEMKVHKECRKKYTHPDYIAKAKKKLEDVADPCPSKKAILRNGETFNFRETCLFCAEEIDFVKMKKTKKEYRRTAYDVRTLTFQDSVKDMAKKRNDALGSLLLKRLSGSIDLVAEEALYHKDCFTSFFCPTSGIKRGRPESDEITTAMDEIYRILEDSDECQFSLKELTENLSYIPSVKTIKRKLIEKYDDDIIISSIQNRDMVICFRRTGSKLLSDMWYAERKNNMEEERKRVVRTAAAIILEDVRSMVSKPTNL